MDDAQTPQTTSISDELRLPVALTLLKSTLARMKQAREYIPDHHSYDKEAGALATTIRKVQRFLT